MLTARYTPNLQEPHRWKVVVIHAFVPSGNPDRYSSAIFEDESTRALDEATVQHFTIMLTKED